MYIEFVIRTTHLLKWNEKECNYNNQYNNENHNSDDLTFAYGEKVCAIRKIRSSPMYTMSITANRSNKTNLLAYVTITVGVLIILRI